MIITQTSLRVSFLGGNTDFRQYYTKHGGMVLTSTINKYIYCIVKERFDDLIIVNYTTRECVSRVKDIKHDLVREALRLLGITKGVEISFLADIPSAGTGLGSSSSVTVGVLNALHNYLGDPVSPMQLAEEAVQIEVDILKKPIGVQDQYAVALGGIRLINFSEDSIWGERLEISESIQEDFNNSLMLFYTNTTRKSEEVLSSLDLEGNLELLHDNQQLALLGGKFLVNGNLGGFGYSLNTYWEAKKKLSDRISTKEIDEMYQTARKAGAIGGKILGAGGGGFLLVMFPANKRASVRKSLKDYKELPFRFENDGSKVIFNIRG